MSKLVKKFSKKGTIPLYEIMLRGSSWQFSMDIIIVRKQTISKEKTTQINLPEHLHYVVHRLKQLLDRDFRQIEYLLKPCYFKKKRNL